ncbi:MAG: SPASM domain-containing protein [Syntrophobacteraceae bacterium]
MRPERDFSTYLDAVRSRAVELPYNPPVVFLETVRGCPHSCAMCHFRHTKVQRIGGALLDGLEPYFRDLEVLAVHGQGEPLLGDLTYFVDQSVKHRFVLHMNTSGFLLTKRLSDVLSQTRLSIRFSVHAGTRETYRRLMGHDLDKVQQNVTYLVDKARKSGHASDFWLSFLVLKENLGEVEDFLHLAHDCGIRSVRFMRPIPNMKTLLGARLPDRDFRFLYFEQFNNSVLRQFMKSLPRYQALCDELGLKIEPGSLSASPSNHHPMLESLNNLMLPLFGNNLFPLRKTRGFCLAPWIGQLVVNLEGNVRLCCSTTYSLGNLRRSTLSEIWNSREMQAIRTAFARGHTPKACAYCQGFGFADYPSNSFISRSAKATSL